MFSVSHTAPRITQEEEERDYADLLPNEKDDILDDIFGRNAEEIAERNSREITQQELDAFHKALEEIPLQDRMDVEAATLYCPELISSESDPKHYLRCEEYNPEKAAARFVEYWKMRVEIFGEEKAFLPMTLTGAYADDEEVLNMMADFPLFRTFLPDDEHGRTVIYGRTSHQSTEYNNIHRDVKLRYVWFNAQMAAKRKSSICRGVVCIFHQSRNFRISLFDRIKEKKLMKIWLGVMPMKVRAIHYCCVQGSVQDMMLPVVKAFMTRDIRQRFICHPLQTSPKLIHRSLEEILPYGFTAGGIPSSLGGTFEVNYNWIQDQLTTEERNSQKSLNDEHDTEH
mmetsp:Transcript_9018/g.13872  ORF Transcript_9018/g.13872 Transcript_9018/m.13872 type:complete len:341 (-) Transcript_9018:274-1296(-)